MQSPTGPARTGLPGDTTRSPTSNRHEPAPNASTTPTISGDDLWATCRQVALGDVQVGPAHPADRDPHSELARTWQRHRHLGERQGMAVDRARI